MRNIGEQERAVTWQQAQLILGYERMGNALAEDLQNQPELREELSSLLHDNSLGYEGVVRYYFFESGRDFSLLVQSPFVRAFETTPQCRGEEIEFLEGMKRFATRVGDQIPEEVAENFKDWVETRIGFMTKGLQRCVLDSGLIDPLTPEERASRFAKGLRQWREDNPARATEIQMMATKAAADSAKPIVFTDEVRAQIQQWFDRELDLETVVELLRGIGVFTTVRSISYTVGVYEDLHYTLDEVRRNQRDGFLKAAREIFSLTGSRQETKQILKALGHSPAKTHAALHRLGLRERNDWKKVIEIGGEK